MHVMRLISGDLWAGAEVQLFHLVRALRQYADVKAEVVLFNHGVLEERLREAGVRTTVVDETRMNGLELLRRLIRILRARRPDILHSKRYKENVLGSIAALASSTKSVRTVHGAPEFSVPRFDLRKSVPQWLDRLCARRLQQRVICVSPQLTRFYDWLPPRRVNVVVNGVDWEALERQTREPAALPGAAGRIRIAFVGRMEPVKRVDLIIEVARCLQARRSDRYRFYLFGEGPLRSLHADQARASGLGDTVQFMGFVPAPAPYLPQMDVLLMTSDHEGLPMSVLEALYLKVHVVSHAVGALAELLGGGKYGALIHSQQPEDYADAIEAYAQAPGLWNERAEAGRRFVTAQYSSERTAREYLRIYREVVAG